MRRPDTTTLILGVVTLVLIFLAWYQGGVPLVWEGLKQGLLTLWHVTFLLLAAFLVAGLTQVLLSRAFVQRWLGASSGWRGILIAAVAGAVMPGGPYVYYPIAAVLLTNGASLGGMVAFVTGKNLWSLSRLPLEFALLGPHLTEIRYIATLFLPPLLGLLSEALLGEQVESVREAMMR